ncbi:NADH dehydrogenase [Saccharospirillum sp. MSK14-1]|nr:NADH dehydrogenase [Saccharospirillum sp. MSK14-1]
MVELNLGWSAALVYVVGYLLVSWSAARPWRVATAVATVSLLISLALLLAAPVAALLYGYEADKVGLVAAVLVTLLGWVIVRYSQRYLAGEPGQQRFVRSLLFTITAVMILVVSQHLVVIVLAWSATSVGLHHLLTFYPDRKAAQVVAHKKFLFSRLAEICLVIALWLIYQAVGSLSLSALQQHLAGATQASAGLHLAAVLFALAAILKTAQLPLHGWLIQVMEAPTPVSALLHAGVVNMGGLVLIRLADLMAVSVSAQWLLVVVGSLTAVLAGLVMLTRVSVKVRLAWSTCAQMGFMLMEIGLGLYELALLHLVAHSCYKAYSFLSAGETVRYARLGDMLSPADGQRPYGWYLITAVVSVLLVFGSAELWHLLLPELRVPAAALWIVALGLASLLWVEQGSLLRQWVSGLVRVLTLTQLYLLWHWLFSGLAPTATQAEPGALVWVVACFGALYAIQIWLRRYPSGRFARRFYPWAFGGFYLDETVTRLTFKIWPVRFSAVQARTMANPTLKSQGESQ